MLKLSKTISMQPGMVYAVRLNITGGKTFCGEGVLSFIFCYYHVSFCIFLDKITKLRKFVRLFS